MTEIDHQLLGNKKSKKAQMKMKKWLDQGNITGNKPTTIFSAIMQTNKHPNSPYRPKIPATLEHQKKILSSNGNIKKSCLNSISSQTVTKTLGKRSTLNFLRKSWHLWSSMFHTKSSNTKLKQEMQRKEGAILHLISNRIFLGRIWTENTLKRSFLKQIRVWVWIFTYLETK